MNNKDQKIKTAIDGIFEKSEESLKKLVAEFKEGKIEIQKIRDKFYQVGKQLQTGIQGLVDTRNIRGRNYSYVSWKWYEYILRKIDGEHDHWVYNDTEYGAVYVAINWLGKEYKGFYGADKAKFAGEDINRTTPLKTTGERNADASKRGYAKLASRQTGLFWNLWLEGGNN